jgi:hypothetical protein
MEALPHNLWVARPAGRGWTGGVASVVLPPTAGEGAPHEPRVNLMA